MKDTTEKTPFEAWIKTRLSARSEIGLLRQLPPAIEGVDFFSNDYLGIAQDSSLYHKVHARLLAAKDTRLLGATGARLLSGNAEYVMQVEQALATFFSGTKSAFV